MFKWLGKVTLMERKEKEMLDMKKPKSLNEDLSLNEDRIGTSDLSLKEDHILFLGDSWDSRLDL